MQKIKVINEKKDSLIKGAFSLTVSVIIVKIIGFLYKVPLSHIMGDEGMGYFNSAYTVFTFFYMICSGGVPRAISIVVAEFDTKGNTLASKRVFILAMRIFLCIGIIFSILLMLFSGFFSSLIGSSLSAFSLFLIAPSLAFVAASGVIRGYLNGKRKMVPIAVAEVVEGSIKFVFGLALALLAARLKYAYYMISAFAVLGVTIGSFVGSLFLYIYAKNIKNAEKTEQYENNHISDRTIIWRVVKIAFPITLSSAIMGISNIIDLGMIIKRLTYSGMTEADAVSLYGNFTTLAVPLLNLVMALISPISASSLPHLTSYYNSKDKGGLKKLNEALLKFTAIFTVPMSFAYFLFSREILLLLFNDESAGIAAVLLSILSPAVILMPILTITNTVLESAALPRFSLISMLAGAFIKLILSYFLIGRLGIAGAPISTGVSYAFSLILSLFFERFACGIKIFISKILFAPILFSAASVGISRIMYIYTSDGKDNLPLFLIFALISCVLYMTFLCLFMRKDIEEAVAFVKLNKKEQFTL